MVRHHAHTKRPLRKMIRQEQLFREAAGLIRAGALPAFMELLIQHPELAIARAMPDSLDKQNTLLHLTTGMGEPTWPEEVPNLAKALLEAGARVDAPENPDGGETPLHCAVSANNVPVAKVLLAYGADTEQPGPYHSGLDTALGYALYYGHDKRWPRFKINVTELLLRAGARVALPFAAALGRAEEVAAFFHGNGKQQEPSGLEMSRALCFACRYNRLAIVKYLLQRGASPSACIPFFHEEVTPLHYATDSDDKLRLIRLLLRHGADPTAKDGSFRMSPSGWAMIQGNHRAFDLLRSAEGRARK